MVDVIMYVYCVSEKEFEASSCQLSPCTVQNRSGK